MDDASSSPAVIPPAALPDVVYVLESEWPHRAVPVAPRRPAARVQASAPETDAAGAGRGGAAG